MRVPRNVIPFDHGALKRLRIERGLTQAELADAIGLSRRFSISDWERNKRPTLATMNKLANALGVRTKDLLVPVEDDQRDLRRLRIEAGLEVDEVAQLLGVPKPTYADWEAKLTISLIEIVDIDALAQVLGVTGETVVKAVKLSSRRNRYANWPFGE